MKKIYLIMPVRNITEGQRYDLDKYVNRLEHVGNKVHYPIRDVDQASDGLVCCIENYKSMKKCDEVYVYFDKTSQGSFFDLGMAFAMNKKIKQINPIVFENNNSFEFLITEMYEKKRSDLK